MNDMTQLTDDPIDPRLQSWLDELKPVPPRDPQLAARARGRFLSEVSGLRAAVSPAPAARRKEWMTFRKERFSMISTLTTLLLVFGLVAGGAGTVYAAQDSLPNESLYPVKTFTEDVRLDLTPDRQAQIELLMSFAQERVEEIASLVDEGSVPPDPVMLRLDRHLQQAIQLAQGVDDESLPQTLSRMQISMMIQEQVLEQAQQHALPDEAPALERARNQLRFRLRLVEDGLADPPGFRNMNQQQRQHQYDITLTPPAPQSPAQQTPAQNQYQSPGPHGSGPGEPSLTETVVSPAPQGPGAGGSGQAPTPRGPGGGKGGGGGRP
jgi:hypothetical protein